jgi:hypothetical protein
MLPLSLILLFFFLSFGVQLHVETVKMPRLRKMEDATSVWHENFPNLRPKETEHVTLVSYFRQEKYNFRRT